jgi:hypothetical protein
MRRGLLAALLLSGCAVDVASPFSAVVVAYDNTNDLYKLAVVRVATVTSLRRLQGTSGTVLAGGAAKADPQAYLEAGVTVSNLRSRLLTSTPQPVDLSFNTVSGLVYPENYTSLELLTAYANVEKARVSFGSWGLTTFPPAPIYAHTPLVDAQGLSPLADGELYYPPLGSFFLPEPSQKAQLPLHFNLGAVGHGVALQAYQQVVWNLAPIDPSSAVAQSDPDALPARHVSASVQMGLADFLGTAVTCVGGSNCDPEWFDHSLQQSGGTRDLDQLHCGTGDMLRALDQDDTCANCAAYDPYPLGTVLAYSLWENIPQTGPGVQPIAQAVVAALQGIGSAQSGNAGKLTLAATLNALVTAVAVIAPDSVPAICGSFQNRFAALSIVDLSACGGVVAVPPVELCQ